ncbi:hypothetical protein MBLNU13_g02321t1 [Cladosporium sp. NU13]
MGNAASDLGSGIGSAASQYFDTPISETISKSQDTLSRVDDTLSCAQWCLRCVSVVTGITSTVSGACTAYQSITDAKAKSHLETLGQTVSEDVKEVNNSMDTLIGLDEPSKLSEHIYNFVRQQAELDGLQPGTKDLFFVYHPGSNWWPEFDKLLKKSPLAGFCGKTNEIEALIMALVSIRLAVRDKPEQHVFHVLVPSAHLYVITDVIVIPEYLGPISIEGEKDRRNKPFVYVTMPKCYHTLTSNIGCLESKSAVQCDDRTAVKEIPSLPSSVKSRLTTEAPAPASHDSPPQKKSKERSTLGRDLAVGAAGVAAGFGGGIAGLVGGSAVGLGNPVVAFTGAAAGAVQSGRAAARRVESQWDR